VIVDTASRLSSRKPAALTHLDDVGWGGSQTYARRMNTLISDDETPAYGIFGAIRRHASIRPNDVALIKPRSEPLSYSQLAAAIEDARITLRNAGFDATARIGIALSYSAEAVLTTVSIACNGVAVPIDPRLTVAELEERLVALRLNAIVLQHGLDSAARCAAERTGLHSGDGALRSE
jgi:long-subunit acyl-CoA synthetase (AMP-forming)